MHPPLGWFSLNHGAVLSLRVSLRIATIHHVRGGTVEIIGVIVAGIIIGLLGKFVAPGNRDNIPIWLTIICGIGGVLIVLLI